MEIVGISSVNVTVSFTEPGNNADGTPLQDLVATRVYYAIDGGPPVMAAEIPASLPTGGGTVTQEVTVPIAAGQDSMVDFYATAIDDADPVNESVPSESVRLNIDRQPPAAPI